MKPKLPILFLTSLLLTACAAPHYGWVKEGASGYDTTNAQSECRYQVALNKIAASDQWNLIKLCMQGKGYRYRQLS
jgi:hypothetical protein